MACCKLTCCCRQSLKPQQQQRVRLVQVHLRCLVPDMCRCLAELSLCLSPLATHSEQRSQTQRGLQTDRTLWSDGGRPLSGTVYQSSYTVLDVAQHCCLTSTHKLLYSVFSCVATAFLLYTALTLSHASCMVFIGKICYLMWCSAVRQPVIPVPVMFCRQAGFHHAYIMSLHARCTLFGILSPLRAS